MNIKAKITEWQKGCVSELCSDTEEREMNDDLEMVLFAIDTLTDLDNKGKV